MQTVLFFWVIAQGYLAPVQTVQFNDAAACADALTQVSASYGKSHDSLQQFVGLCVAATSPAADPVAKPSGVVTPSVPVAPPAQHCTFLNGKSYCSDVAK